MSKTSIAPENKPFEVELVPGTYYWCACGHSNNQPFCDGSHSGTDITPLALEVKEQATYWLCGCKATKDQPYCDGSHNLLD